MNFVKLAGTAALVSMAFAAQAQQVITTSGGVSIGIQADGALGAYPSSGPMVGLALAGVGDAVTPGCLCEGWGASLGSVSGWSANAAGSSNVTGVSFVSTATSATSIVNVGSGLQVTQAYGLSSSSALVVDHVTLTNTSGSAGQVRYSRAMDWDVPPTPFSELVTLQGVGSANLIYSSDNGFGVPNPLANPGGSFGTENTNFVDNGPADHGAFFTFDFGTLAAGASVSFDVYYGAAGNAADALSALGTVGAEVYSLGKSSGPTGFETGAPATFIFAFSGVGGTPVAAVPEPETYALMLAGLGLVGWMAKRRKA
jgi:hypothetical protein